MSSQLWQTAAVGPVAFEIPSSATSSVEQRADQPDVVRFFGERGLVVAVSAFTVQGLTAVVVRELTSAVIEAYEDRPGYLLRALGLVEVAGAAVADAASFVWLSPKEEQVSSVCVAGVVAGGRAALVHACMPKLNEDDDPSWMKSVVESIRFDVAMPA